MEATYKTKNHIAAVMLLVVIVIFMRVFMPVRAFAASEYSEVLVDLQRDETFDSAAYPVDPADGTLKVINIAESTAGELFIYVYRPSAGVKELPAIEIRMSTTVGDSYSPKDYALRRISANGTLEKYVVEDFTVKPDMLRYYDIICIFRAFDSDYDEPATDNNTVSETEIPVKKGYTATTVNGVVSYTCTEIKAVEVIDKYVGYLRYEASDISAIWQMDKDNHFVAFSTDYRIDELMEADITYVKQVERMSSAFTGSKTTFDDPEIVEDTIYASDSTDIDTGVFFKKKYTWNHIVSGTEFKGSVELADEAVQGLAGKKWVLRFLTTDYKDGRNFGDLVAGTYVSTHVRDVSLLRLKFVTDGKVYNLGVVDNKQTGSDKPVGGSGQSIPSWAWWLFAAFIALVVFVLVVIFLPNGINIVLSIFKAIGKGIYFILSLPVRFVRWIAERRDGGK